MAPTDAAHPRGPTRRDPSLLWVVAIVLLVGRLVLGFREAKNPTSRADHVSWVPAAGAPAAARMSGRPIFYDFSAEWCGPCRRMEQDVFADERKAKALSRLAVPVHVVDRQREEGRNPALVDSLQRAYGVTAFPTLVLADADGKTLAKLEGYPGADEFVQWVARGAAQHKLGQTKSGTITFP
jgi:thiol:disulfide interchange protein